MDPQHIPPFKEQSQALLHSAAEKGWELLQEKEKKGEKKLNFPSEIVLVTGRLSPTCSRAQGVLAPRPPFPVKPGMGAREPLAARCSPRDGQGPAAGDRSVPWGPCRSAVLTPARRKGPQRIIVGRGSGGLETTERAKRRNKPQSRDGWEEQNIEVSRPAPLPLASPWPAAPRELKKTCTLKGG